ncbi:MAG: ABC transporter substrate-binding protein [Xanthobacteraceae bacterium]|nr:ABC transporter substrate-binding protein [Xanthobacteraceae bacterium]
MPTIVRAADEILVAGILPLTGPSAQFGQQSWKAMQFAVDLMNEAGGVKSMGGAKLILAVFDTETKPEIAVTQTENAIQRGAKALIGCNQSAATIVASQVSERNEVPFLTAYDIDPTITARGFKYIFRCSPLTGNYASDLLTTAKELIDKAGSSAKRVGLLSENSVAGQGVNKALTAVAQKLGLELVYAETYDVGTTQNFAPFITKMKANRVDIMVGQNRVSDGIQITRTAKELAYNPSFMGGVLGAPITREYIEALGKDADNVFGTDSFSPALNAPGLPAVVERVKVKMNRVMDVGVATIMADIAVIWDALERAKTSDPRALRDAIASTDLNTGDRNFFMLRGAKFSDKGDNEKAAGIVTQIQNGLAVPVWPVEFAKAQAVYPKPEWN